MHKDCYDKWSHETFNGIIDGDVMTDMFGEGGKEEVVEYYQGLENVSDSVEDHHPTPDTVPVVTV